MIGSSFKFFLEKSYVVSMAIFGIAALILALDSFIFGFGVLGWVVNDPTGQLTGGIVFLLGLIGFWTGGLNGLITEGFTYNNIYMFVLSSAFFILLIWLYFFAD